MILRGRRASAYTAAVRARFAVLAACTFVALPLHAHGENLAVGCAAVVHAVPAIALLVVRWHAWRVRLFVAATLGLAAVVLWRIVVPAMMGAETSCLFEWLLLLSPTLIALMLALLLRALVPRPL